MFSSLIPIFEEYPALVTILSGMVILGAIGFVPMMAFNIKSFLTYRKRRADDKNGEVEKEHSILFWAVDGFFTFALSLDFLTFFLIFI